MGISGTLFYILIALITVLAIYVKQYFSFWKRRGIPHDDPVLWHGNVKGLGTTRHLRDIGQAYYEKYKKIGSPFVGLFYFLDRAVMILDFDLIRNILIRDFQNFTDRGQFSNERDDPLTGNLFSVDGPKWKYLRHKLTTTFTSGKMKGMFSTVISLAGNLVSTFEEITAHNTVVDVKDMMARFTTDVIGTCAFGLDCNSLADPNAEFRVFGTKAFLQSRHRKLVSGFITNFPKLARRLGMRVIHEEIHQFFMRVVRETVEYREKNSIKRNDFMNLLIELKNSEDGLTMEDISAQSFVFFLGGFETSSSAMGFALYELAFNQHIQDKLRAEVMALMEKNGGKLTYECLAEMHYMEMVIKETLRKYTALPTLNRRANEDYPTSNPKYIIPKGTLVMIPADAIHRDPDVYPDPEKFDPERFTPEEIRKRHPATFLAFGDGPRNCIGLRFGKMQTYIGIGMLLSRYRFHCCEKTPRKLPIEEKSFLLSSKGGVFLRVERIQ